MADVIDLDIDDLSRFREVGSGGFATVYAAWDAGFRRWVAVKVLPALDEDGRRRFDRERALMGQLDAHPNVVTPYRSGYTPSGDAFLVMEYLDGGSLLDFLRRRGSLSVDQAIDHLLPVTGAVEAGHRLNILHRDIKPANILLTAEGVPKLTDFGISATRDATTTMAAFTLAHAPPESFADGYDRQDERSDLYSLASTLYTLIRGRPPFEISGQDSARAQLMRILTHAPGPIGRPDVDEFFAIGLAKDPDGRYQSAGELAAAMKALSLGARSLRSSGNGGQADGVDTLTGPPGVAPSRSAISGLVPPRPAVSGDRSLLSPQPPHDDVADGPSPIVPQPRRSIGTLAAVGALLTVAAAFALLLGGLAYRGEVEPGPTSDTGFENASPRVTTGLTTTAVGPFDTSQITAPGPGSFSIGQLKLGLLGADDLPTEWTIGEETIVRDSGMGLPCNDRFAWSPDSSSPQVIGRYHGPIGSSNIEHTVWALDEWVAADLFEQTAAATTGCVESWTEPPGQGDEHSQDVAVIQSPQIAGRGSDSVVSTVVAAASDGEERQIVTVLTRCGGLVSRLVLSTTPAADGTVTDNLADGIAGSAYDRLVGVAEWENATCPPS